MAAQIDQTRLAIYRALLEFGQNQTRLDQIFESSFKKSEHSGKEKRFIKMVVSGVVRHLLLLDWVAARLYDGNYRKMLVKVKTLLRAGLFEIVYLKQIPSHATVNEYVQLAGKMAGKKTGNLINAILRNYLRLSAPPDPKKELNNSSERLSVAYSFPLWLIKRWMALWGEKETEALCRRLNMPPKFSLRVNAGVTNTRSLSREMQEQGIAVEISETNPDYLRTTAMQEVLNGGWVGKGFCTVQDESAGMPVRLLRLGEKQSFLDICAAPGGKFTQALESSTNLRIAVAVDQDKKRLQRVKENVSRYRGAPALFVVADGRALPFKIKFDRILLDAPCSGLGVIRKHPDIKWRREMKDLVEFSGLQYQLLQAAMETLESTGRLVYSTCTIDPLENDGVIDRFLVNHQETSVEPTPDWARPYASKKRIYTRPDRFEMDGSFCVALKRKKIL